MRRGKGSKEEWKEEGEGWKEGNWREIESGGRKSRKDLGCSGEGSGR